MQVTQVALSHTTTQCNTKVERGLPKQPKIKIKKLSKEQALDKTTQTKEKDYPL